MPAAPLRILGIVAVHCHPDWRGSGVARTATDLLAELARRGNRVTVLSPLADGVRRFDPPAQTSFYDGNLRLLYSATAHPSRLGTTAHGLADLWHSAAAAADAVDIHSFMSAWTDSAAARARRAGIPYVIHDHGKLTTSVLANRSLAKRAYLALRGRRVLRGAAFVSPSTLSLERAIAAWDPALRVRHCTNGLDPAEFDAPPPPRPIPEPYVLYFGWLDPRKNPGMLIRAFARAAAAAPGWKLALVGPDGYNMESSLREISRQECVADRVLFPGMARGEQKLAWLKNAALYVLPSDGEGLSLAMLEAMACGLPCLLSPGCNYPEIETERAGRVISIDPHQWAAALRHYMQTPADRDAAGKNARRLFLQRHRLSLVGAELERLLRDAAAQRATAPT